MTKILSGYLFMTRSYYGNVCLVIALYALFSRWPRKIKKSHSKQKRLPLFIRFVSQKGDISHLRENWFAIFSVTASKGGIFLKWYSPCKGGDETQRSCRLVSRHHVASASNHNVRKVTNWFVPSGNKLKLIIKSVGK